MVWPYLRGVPDAKYGAGFIVIILSHTQNRPKGASRRPPSRKKIREAGSLSDSLEKSFTPEDIFFDKAPPLQRASEEAPATKPERSSREPSKSPKLARKKPPVSAAKKKDDLFDDFLSASPPETKAKPVVIEPKPAKSLVDELEKEISEETGLFSSKKGASKVKVSFGDDLFAGGDDLFGEGGEAANDLFSAPATSPKPSIGTKTGSPEMAATLQTDNDLFAPVIAKPDKKDTEPDKKDTQPDKKDTEPTIDIFEVPPEDIFTTEKPKASIDDIFSADTGGKSQKGLDDLFAAESPKTRRKKEKGSEEKGKDSVDGKGVREAAATVAEPPSSTTEVKKKKVKGTKKTAKKHKERPDEELFGNTDDIFGDLPPSQPKSPKPKKKKKKVASAGATPTAEGEGTGAATSAVGEESSRPKKKGKKKTVKKVSSEPQDLSMFEENAPSIFDDPLNALNTS